jgi:hypothetical protein
LTVVGGASKLFKYFINQYSPNSIVSYANANYSNGNLYRAIGMTYSHFNDSSYVYIRGDEVKFSVEEFSKLMHEYKYQEAWKMLDEGISCNDHTIYYKKC